MKKFVAIILTCNLVVGICMVALATKTTNGNTDTLANNGSSPTDTSSMDIIGIYVESSSGIVYCVDITWGNMQFTYYKSEGLSWDPSNYTYGTGTDIWNIVTGGGNCVTIENHSNDKIYATVDCEFNAKYSGLRGTILQTSDSNQSSTFTSYTNETETHYGLPAYLTIESAVGIGNTWETGQPTGQVQLDIDGDTGGALSDTEMGSVTVGITSIQPELNT